MYLSKPLITLPLQIYKFCSTPTLFYLSCTHLLTTTSPFSFFSLLFLNLTGPLSLKNLLQLYYMSTRSPVLWRSTSLSVRAAFRRRVMKFRSYKWRTSSKVSTRLLTSTFQLVRRYKLVNRVSTPRTNVLHPYFANLQPSSGRKKFPLLDPVRRYKDFDVSDRGNSFLRTEAPLRPQSTSTPSKPTGFKKRSLLLHKLLKKANKLKIYTFLNSLCTPQLSQIRTPHTRLFIGRPSLRLLRRERRLYIRMLPQMRLSYDTLTVLRENDVRYWLIKGCYLKYRASTRDDSVRKSLGQNKYRNSSVRVKPTPEDLFYYRRLKVFSALRNTSTEQSLTSGRFVPVSARLYRPALPVISEACDDLALLDLSDSQSTEDLVHRLKNFYNKSLVHSLDIESSELMKPKLLSSSFLKTKHILDLRSGTSTPLVARATMLSRKAIKLLAIRRSSYKNQISDDFSLFNYYFRQRRKFMKRKLRKLSRIRLSRRLNSRSEWPRQIQSLRIAAAMSLLDRRVKLGRRLINLIRYRRKFPKKTRRNRTKSRLSLKQLRAKTRSALMVPRRRRTSDHRVANVNPIRRIPLSTRFRNNIFFRSSLTPWIHHGSTSSRQILNQLTRILFPAVYPTSRIREAANLPLLLAIGGFRKLKLDRYWWDRRAKRRQRRKLILRYVTVRKLYTIQFIQNLDIFFSYLRSPLEVLRLSGLSNHYPNPSRILDTSRTHLNNPHLMAKVSTKLNPTYSFRPTKLFIVSRSLYDLHAVVHSSSNISHEVLRKYLTDVEIIESNDVLADHLPSFMSPKRLACDNELSRLSLSSATNSFELVPDVALGSTFYEVQIKTRHTNPFILPAYGFMYLFNVDKDLTNTSVWHARLNKMLYSFADLLDVKRYILRRFTKSVMTSTATSSRIDSFLSTRRLPFLNNPLTSGIATNATAGGSHWISSKYDRLDSHTLDIPGRSNPLALTNYTMRIKRIRFKPGYSRIWRQARTSLQKLTGLNFRYQQKLTTYLLRFLRLKQNFSFKSENLRLGKVLERVHFANDFLSHNTLIEWQSVYVNGYVAENSQLVLCVNDFIQMIVHLKYYITYRWLGHWALKKRNRIFKLKKLKWKPTSFRLDKQRSYSLPNWLLDYKTINFDLPKYLEVDYLTLSVFVIYEPFMYSDLYLSPELLPRSQVLNMYNWKYIT